MTIPELGQYLSRAFPYVENLGYMSSTTSEIENQMPDGSNLPFIHLQRAYLADYYAVDNCSRDEHPEFDGLLVHIHSRFSPVNSHSHDFFEMMYVRTGNITHHIGEESIELSAGDFLMIALGVYHRIDNCAENDIALNFIIGVDYFTPSFLHLISRNQLFYDFIMYRILDKPSDKNYIHIQAGEFPDVLETADNMLCEFFEPDFCSVSMLKCMFPGLLNRLFRVWKESGGTIRPRKKMDDDDIQQILKYIETNYAAASLKEAAARFGYHPDYLSRLIKNKLGHTFSAVKHRICIDQAKFLLISSDLTVQQIAEHVGFSNMSFFYELFDRYCGTTPARYREDFGQEKLQL